MKKATLQTDGTLKVEELTTEETTLYNADAAADKVSRDAIIAAEAKQTTDAAAGKAKLKELGLTDDQIAALVG